MSTIESVSQTGDHTVSAFFDTRAHVEQARDDLISAGLAESAITVVGSEAERSEAAGNEPMGFWESLTNLFVPDEDRHVYAEGVRRGGYAITVRCSGVQYSTAIDILDRDGAVDLDERATTWEGEGWSRARGGVDNIDVSATPYEPVDNSTAGFGGSYAGEDGLAGDAAQPGFGGAVAPSRIGETANPDLRGRIGAGTSSFDTPAATGGPQSGTIPARPADDAALTRDLSHGRTRVRSYVVENDINR